MSLKEIKTKTLCWLNIANADEKEIDCLRQRYNFHPLDLEDCFKTGQRPKIEKYSDYLFLVLLFPIYNKATREIEPEEIDFFIGKDFFVTVHDNRLPPLCELNELCQLNDQAREKYLKKPALLLYEILNKLLSHCYPMLDHLSIDIRNVEKQIFNGQAKKIIQDVLIIRRNITDFRKIMQAHKNTLKKLSDIIKQNGYLDSEKTNIYYGSLVEQTKEIWDHLESYKESIEALQKTHESLISFRLNDIMKNFTTISVIIFSMTLVATTFGIGAKNTPFVHHPWAFWIIAAVLIVVASSMWQFFKTKKWLQ